MFEPTPDQELDWEIHNDHAGDWDDDGDGGMVEFDEGYGEDFSDEFNDGEFW